MAGLVVSRSHLRSAPPRRAAPPRSSTPRSALSPPLNRTRRWRARTPRWCVSPTLSRVRSRPGASARRPRAAVRSNRASASQIPNRPPPPFSPPPPPQSVHGTALETRGEITATAYDTSGTRMATCTSSGAIHVWDRAADAPDGSPGVWRQTSAWAAHDAPCLAVAFADAEHGQCLASSDCSGAVRVWREPPRSADPKAALAASRAARRRAPRRDPRRHLGAARRDAAERRAPPRLRAPRRRPGSERHPRASLAAAGDDGVVRSTPRGTPTRSRIGSSRTKPRRRLGGACTASRGARRRRVERGRAGPGPRRRPHYPQTRDARGGMHWPATGRSDARVLARDEANARWRVAARLFSGEPRARRRRWRGRRTPTRLAADGDHRRRRRRGGGRVPRGGSPGRCARGGDLR